ncbi:MAG: DUF4091 domain-containing protein [Armatimonadetes bacterium]|nr:DUF4091 domain-containing protein [Armatimonadota bacterium]
MSIYKILAWQPLLRPPAPDQQPPEVPNVPLKALSCRNAVTSFVALVIADVPVESARLVFSDLVCGSDVIPVPAGGMRLVGVVNTSEAGNVCDPLYEVDDFAIDKSAALYMNVFVPKRIAAGTYKGRVALIVDGVEVAANDMALEVINVDLPGVHEWNFFLNVWMNPRAIARRHRVYLWSEEHFAVLRPYIEDLAKHGQKTMVAPICYKPFGDRTHDLYPSLVEWRMRARKFEFDFSIFDRYVELHDECGINKAIHCYSIVQHGKTDQSEIQYLDMDSGERCEKVMHVGDEEYTRAWKAFLEAFEKHLIERGWMHKTFLGFGNLSAEMAEKVVSFVTQNAPEFKMALATDIGIETCDKAEDLSLRMDFDNRGVAEPASAERSAMGIAELLDPDNICLITRRCPEKTSTTFYVCAVPEHPNTFVNSPLVESRMLPFLALQGGYDGFVRWAYNDWSDEPYINPGWGEWPTGDTFLVYPGEAGPVSSLRWEQLREGIQDYELAMIASMNLEDPDEMVDYEQAIMLACRDADGSMKSTGDIEIARRLLIPIAEHMGED